MKINPQQLFSEATALHRAGRLVEAEKQYRKLLKAFPEVAEVHNSHGAVLASIGNLQEAARAFERASALAPDNPRYQFNYANTLLDRADYNEAIKRYQVLLTRNPKHQGVRHHLAMALMRVERNPEAATILHSLCEDYPNSVEVFELYGAVLVKLRRYDFAREVLERALALNPNSINSKIGLADVLMGMNQAEAAIAYVQGAILQHPEDPMLRLKLGRALHEMGDGDQAKKAYEELIRRFPDFIGGYIAYSEVKKFDNNDLPVVRRMQSALKLDPGHVELHFKLGKIHDDLKEFETAFRHYAKGNQLKRQLYPTYQVEDFGVLVDTTIATIDRQFLQVHADLGTDADLPILVVGMPRSGTTLTEQILARHPAIAGAGEVDFWEGVQKNSGGLLGKNASYPDSLSDLNVDQAAVLAKQYVEKLRQLASSEDAQRIVDKMPHNFVRLGLIALIFPRAKIIHVRRSPMDNCLSIFSQSFSGEHPYAYDLEMLGKYYREYQRLMFHWREVLGDRMLEIDYETLVSDTETVTRQMIDFVGLPWDDACLGQSQARGVVRSASIWQARQPVYKSSVERWRNYAPYLDPLMRSLGIDEHTE